MTSSIESTAAAGAARADNEGDSREAGTEHETKGTLGAILRVVKERTGHDFSSYKFSTVTRRIERRMAANDFDRMESYAAFLQEHPEEAEALSRDILIGVTSFFRDPEAFEVMKREVIPALVAGRGPGDPVRIWHPCCATGEEVYSMAILFREHLDAEGLDAKLQFFATDLDEAAIAHARSGLYGDDAVCGLSGERLDRFFTRTGEGWQVSKQLRESIIFAQHSLIKDPPFSRLDLLVCRNFLIYITADMQKRLISLFHQVLKPGRYLFLGAAETIGSGSNLFAPVDKRWKVYQRLEVVRRENAFPIGAALRKVPGVPRPVRSAEVSETAPAAVAEKLLSQRYAPPYVMVNQKYELVHVSPRADRFLRIPSGEPTRDLLRMAVEELKPALRAAIYKAFAEDERVIFKAVTCGGGESVNVVVDPVATASGKLAMVTFEPAPESVDYLPAAAAHPGDETSRDMLVRQLEEQLRLTHEQLFAVTEQLETSHEGFLSANEELMSINEEFQSANEELQSTNEELETSKEELQALNDELVTVNAELQEKVEELKRANSDVENLLKSSDIATLFLDPQLQIKRFTPAFAAIFNLIPADVGRPFSHFASAVDWSGLACDAKRVLKDMTPVEREVTAARDGRHYQMRILPYLDSDEQVNGVVVTLVDLTERKRMEDALLLAKEEWERTFNAVPDLIAIIDADHRVVRANRAMSQRLGISPEACVGAECYRSVHCTAKPDPDCPHMRTLADGREHRAEIRQENLGGDFLVTTTPLFDDSGCMTGSVHVARDITERKRAEEELRQSKQQVEEQLAKLQVILDHLSDGVVISDLDGNLFHWNPAAVAMHGFSSMDECLHSFPDLTAMFELSTAEEGVLPLERWPVSRILAGETLEGWEVQVRRPGSDWMRTFSYGGTIAYDKSGHAILAVVSITDVTEGRRTQAALQENERRLGLALDAGKAAPWEVDLETGRHSWDRRLFELLRVQEEGHDEAEQLWSAFVLPEERGRVQAEFEAACGGESPFHCEFRAQRMDGEVHWYACHGSVVADPGRRRMVGVVQEITDRKKAEELIRRHVEELEATNTELSRFNEVSVGRELRMIELKKEINELCGKAGAPRRYPLEFEESDH